MYDNVHRFGLTRQDQQNLIVEIGLFVQRSIAAAVEPLQARIAALEAKGIKYCGVHQRCAEYQRGDVVSYGGGMWVAACATPPMEVPGKSVCWQLCEKSPRSPTPSRKPPP